MTAVKVIGIFDSMDEARQAREQLVAEGVPADAVRLGPDEGEDALATRSSGAAEEGGFFAWLRSLFTDDDERRYADSTSEAVRRGSCVLAVEAASETEAEQVENIMQAHGAVDVDQREERWRAEGWTGYDETAPRLAGADLERERQLNAEQHVPVVREELRVGKREVVRGGVRVVTRILDRPVEEQVTLREEHARVERRAVDRPATEEELRGLKEGTIEVTERVEEPVIGKSTRVVEEIEVGKEVGTRTETVRDTVRETKVEVEQMAAGTRAAGTVQPGSATPPAVPDTPAKPKQQR